jgi:flagellar motility protein MotE (MotC chaperone)
MKTPTQILLSLLILVKILICSILLYQTGIPFLGESKALASEQKKETQTNKIKNEAKETKETIDVKFLIQKKVQLEKEEKRIAEKKAELLAIQDDINKKILKLTKLRDEIKSERANKKAAEDQQFKHLIKIYSTMKPQNAAELIEKLDIKFAIELLSKMKGDDVGKILSFVKIEKAAKISEGLIKQN